MDGFLYSIHYSLTPTLVYLMKNSFTLVVLTNYFFYYVLISFSFLTALVLKPLGDLFNNSLPGRLLLRKTIDVNVGAIVLQGDHAKRALVSYGVTVAGIKIHIGYQENRQNA